MRVLYDVLLYEDNFESLFRRAIWFVKLGKTGHHTKQNCDFHQLSAAKLKCEAFLNKSPDSFKFCFNCFYLWWTPHADSWNPPQFFWLRWLWGEDEFLWGCKHLIRWLVLSFCLWWCSIYIASKKYQQNSRLILFSRGGVDSGFRCLEGAIVLNTPHQETKIFNPTRNRVN